MEHTELSGHWVSTEYFVGEDFLTVDFEMEVIPTDKSGNDSAYYYVNINKNSLCDGNHKYSLTKSENNYEFFEYGVLDTHKINFDGDSLFMEGYSYNGHFVRVNESESILRELFYQTGIKASLPEKKEQDVSLDIRRYLISNVNIGEDKRGLISKDSTRINVLDVYVTLQDISIFVARQKDTLLETERQSLTISLNADSSVSKEFLNKVIGQINKADSTLKIYQSTFDYKTNKVYYRKLN